LLLLFEGSLVLMRVQERMMKRKASDADAASAEPETGSESG
jgi:hypothetical protein